MTRRAAVTAASLVLEHVPDLVRYGSKPRREPAQLEALAAALGLFDEAVSYAPNQVFIGALRARGPLDPPAQLVAASGRGRRSRGRPRRRHDQQRAYYELLAEVDRFDLVTPKAEPEPGGSRCSTATRSWARSRATTRTTSRSRRTCCSRTSRSRRAACMPCATCWPERASTPASITHAIGCGEEAVGDRYQRGGGNVAKAIAEDCGLDPRERVDVKSFCAAPVHALVVAAALDRGGHRGACGRRGRRLHGQARHEVRGALAKGFPVLEDVLAGMAVLLEPADGSNGPIVRTDAVGRMPVEAGSAPQAQLEALVGAPLDAMGSASPTWTSYATEIHNPEITEPQGGGDVPDRNYKMLAGLGVVRGELGRPTSPRSRAPTACRASRRRRATSRARCRGFRTRWRACGPANCIERC